MDALAAHGMRPMSGTHGRWQSFDPLLCGADELVLTETHCVHLTLADTRQQVAGGRGRRCHWCLV